MKYQISSDNMELTPSMEALTKEKFERIESRLVNYPEDTCFARVVLNTAPENMFTVKVNLEVNGKVHFSDETDFTLESALIRTVEELTVMMEKDSKEKQDRDNEVRREEKYFDPNAADLA